MQFCFRSIGIFIFLWIIGCTPNRPKYYPVESKIDKPNLSTESPQSAPPIIRKYPADLPPILQKKPALNPAIIALLNEADIQSRSGDLNSAAVLLERALRIQPRNAELTFKLAELRLKQSQPKLAQDLLNKAIFLAGNDQALKQRCQLLLQQINLQ